MALVAVVEILGIVVQAQDHRAFRAGWPQDRGRPSME
jgi:hypothetical protein